jgi:hypothetical protein
MTGPRIQVSKAALLARINRKLAGQGERLYASRARDRADVGDYYTVSLSRNAIVRPDVNLLDYARELGVLREYERAAGEDGPAVTHDAAGVTESRPTGKRHPVHRGAPYPKPNREVDRAVVAIDGVCIGLKSVAVEQLDRDRIPAWSESLRESISFLRQFVGRIEGGTR